MDRCQVRPLLVRVAGSCETGRLVAVVLMGWFPEHRGHPFQTMQECLLSQLEWLSQAGFVFQIMVPDTGYPVH